PCRRVVSSYTDECDGSLRGDRDLADGHAAVEGTKNGGNPRVSGDVGEILVLAVHADETTLPTGAPTATHRRIIDRDQLDGVMIDLAHVVVDLSPTTRHAG